MNATSFRSLAALSLALAWAASATGASDAPADPRESNAWFAAGRAAVARAYPMIGESPPAKNVILFVGDGMGVATVTAARILEGQRRGELGEGNLLAFERFPHLALSKTYSSNAQVPDSAATMTAMVSGVKTKSGSLGVSEEIIHGDFRSVEKTRVGTLLEEAETRGLATGVVTTTSVTHATPAACYAHAAFRFWEDDSRLPEEAREAGFPDIARQLVEFEFGDGLEVALGGGRQHFRPQGAVDPEHEDESGGRLDGRDLTQEWLSRREGAVYVWNREQFEAVDLEETQHLLGLFEPKDMNWEADRAADPAGEPALAEMTAL
ncbi:MAG: alkaline phosphatase, partial [Myxococcota bacterium]